MTIRKAKHVLRCFAPRYTNWARSRGKIFRLPIAGRRILALSSHLLPWNWLNKSPTLFWLAARRQLRHCCRRRAQFLLFLAKSSDPVRQGFVDSWANPGGNITGFTNFKSAMPGKWLEIAKDLAPHITRVLLIYHPETTPHDQFVQSVETAAPALGLNLAAIGVNDAAGIEHAFDDFSPKSNSALIVFPAVVTGTYRQLIIELATRLRMPAVYPFRYFVVIGGLAYYGINPLKIVSPRRFLRRPYSQGRKAGRPAGAAAHQIRACDQPQNCEGARPDYPRGSFLARADEMIE